MDQAMQGSDLPAVVAMAMHRNGETLSYVYGKAIWDSEAEVTPDHLFRIYSMTKMVTSIAAMQLVEQGAIGLDDDLSELLPEMAKIPILQNGELHSPTNKITLRHLLTHTSGFGYPITDGDLNAFSTDDWEFEDYPRRFESGTRFLYGTSVDWAGKMVEKLSGKSLDAYFKQHIFEPLQMSRTFYNVPDDLKPLIVSMGHRGPLGQGTLKESPGRVPAAETTKFGGGSGLFSSPADYSKLLTSMLHWGAGPVGRILKKETVLDMTKNQIGDICMDPHGRFFDPSVCCNFTGLIDADSKHGLAFMIDNKNRPWGRKSGAVLWGGLRNTYFYIDYKSGVTACIFSQHLPFNHAATTSLFEKFSELVYRNIR
jgi:CubicO group peptidase (beta-lactamase class C family)